MCKWYYSNESINYSGKKRLPLHILIDVYIYFIHSYL
uniref:Uncharacterized protein n=1 Tax=Lepeophtheirus salmonis TaxID=72036 RepID=A0A0K2URY4_LEPSM